MKLVDRALKTFGLARLLKRAIYKGADFGRLFADWITSVLSSDDEVRRDHRRLRARARDLAKNNPYIKQYLNLLAVNVIGHKGIQLQAQVRNNSGQLNKQINDKIEKAWADWSRKVTADGKQTLTALSQMLVKAMDTDGEIFVRMISGFDGNKYKFALQTIDPDLVDHEFNLAPVDGKNAIRMGVEVDEWGRAVAYWVWTSYPAEYTSSRRDRIRIPASEILHIGDPERVNQTRYTTKFNPVMTTVKMLDGYVEAELVAARTGAAKMGFFKYTDAADFEAPDPNKPINMNAEPGTAQMLPPGLEFQEWSPDHPAAAFPNFVKTMLRQIATGLGVSYNALANDLEGVNYSSMRSGLLIERDLWRARQQQWIDQFLFPVFERWLEYAMLSGALQLDSRDPAKFKEAKWNPRGWAWVDPLKDVTAAALAVQNTLASRTEAIAEQGGDFEAVLEELAEEKRLADEYGIDLVTVTNLNNAQTANAANNSSDNTNSDTNNTDSSRALLTMALRLLDEEKRILQ